MSEKLTDQEWCAKEAGKYTPMQHEIFAACRLQDGIAEGRRREREERLVAAGLRSGSPEFQHIHPEIVLLISEREESAAREAFEFLFAENEANGFTDIRGFTLEKFVDSSMRAMAEWKQRKSQGG